MSKKNKAGLILLAGVLTFGAVGALASCGETTPTEPDKPDKPDVPDKPDTPDTPTNPVKALTIANKEDLTAKWYAGEEDRDINLTLDPTNLNIGELIDNGDITVTSSNPEVIAAFNLKLKALTAGKATITVEAGDIKDSVEITVDNLDLIDIKTAYTHKVGDVVAVKGVYMGAFEDQFKGLFFGNGEYGISTYGAKAPEGLKVGDHAIVMGTVDIYGGLFQLKNCKIRKAEEPTDAVEPVTLNIESLADVKGETHTSRRATAKGTVLDHKREQKDSKGTKYEVISFKLQINETDKLSIRADSRVCVAEEFEKLDTIKDGDFVTINGFSTFFIFDQKTLPTDKTGFQIVKPTLGETERVPATAITLTSEKTTLNVNETITVTTEVTPADSTDRIDIVATAGAEFIEISGNTIKGLAAGTATIVAKAGDVTSEPLTLTVSSTVVDPLEEKAIPTTIAELAKKPISTTEFYKVTGVVNNANPDDKYGNVEIVDKTTKDALTSWGCAADKSALVLEPEIKFENPKNFNTNVINKSFKLGDEVTFYASVYDKYGNSGKAGIGLVFKEIATPAAEIKYTVDAKSDLVTLSKTTDLVYGEEIVITPVAEKVTEGKEIQVKVNDSKIKAEADGTFKYNIKAINTFEIALVDQLPPLPEGTLAKIGFKAEGADEDKGSSISNLTDFQNNLTDDSQYPEIKAVAASKVYGNSSKGLKFGTGSSVGQLTLTLNEATAIKTIKLNSEQYKAKEGKFTVTIGTKVIEAQIAANGTELTFTLAEAVTTDTIIISTVKGAERACLSGLTILSK